jgi:predicted nucleic acid-binding Zn ribbon protein
MGDRDLPLRLRDVIATAADQLRLGHAVEMGRLWARWRELVGPAIADHAEPTSLRGHVLRVRVDSPTWATEIGYLREEIARRANEALGREVIGEVRVWTAPGRPAAGRPDEPEARRDRLQRGPPENAAEAFARARRAWSERRTRDLGERPAEARQDRKKSC